MNNEENFSKLFGQIEILITRLHRIKEETYRFVNEQDLRIKNQSLKKTITETLSLVDKTLNGLLKQIKTKIDDIHKS